MGSWRDPGIVGDPADISTKLFQGRIIERLSIFDPLFRMAKFGGLARGPGAADLRFFFHFKRRLLVKCNQ